MRRRRGIVLPSVLAALVIMAMIVAISAQRALVAARLGGLILARADLAAAVAAAQAAALEAAADSVDGARMTQGELLSVGETTAGAAQASWRIVGAAAPFALVEIDARAPLLRG